MQAAPPLKDSGNDLIAVKGRVIKAIQVKTTTTSRFDTKRPEYYDLAALVALRGEGRELDLEKTQVFLVPKEVDRDTPPSQLAEWTLTADLVQRLFSNT